MSEIMKDKRTKAVGYLMIVAAVVNVVVDVLNGGSFNFSEHLNAMFVASTGAGIIFMRDGIKKVQDAIEKSK